MLCLSESLRRRAQLSLNGENSTLGTLCVNLGGSVSIEKDIRALDVAVEDLHQTCLEAYAFLQWTLLSYIN